MKRNQVERQNSNRTSEISTPGFKPDTCCSSQVSKFPSNPHVCYHIVKAPWDFLINSDFIFSPNPRPPVDHPAKVQLVPLLLRAVIFLPDSLHLRPPPSCMPVTNALPICAYETNYCYPSPFKNHCPGFHILLLLRSLSSILPTSIKTPLGFMSVMSWLLGPDLQWPWRCVKIRLKKPKVFPP